MTGELCEGEILWDPCAAEFLKLSNDASSKSGSKSGNSGLGKGGKLKPEYVCWEDDDEL